MPDLNKVPGRITRRGCSRSIRFNAAIRVLCRRATSIGVARGSLLRPLIGAVLAGVFVSPVQAGEVSAWVQSQHSAARLIDAGPRRDRSSAGGRLVGIEIRLDPSYITYWRSPGDAGVAPTFDFKGSDNLRNAQVLFPAPRRLDEDGMAAFGYIAGVIFPVVVEGEDASRPLTLDVQLDYAVCARICLPAKANLRLQLGGGGSAEAQAVEAALAAVPQPRDLAQAGPLRIDAIVATPDGPAVQATTPDGTGTLFAEAPEPWFVAAAPAQAVGQGRLSFRLTVPDRPAGPVPHAPLRLTLVGQDGAIEVSVPLDEALPKP